MIVFDIEQRTEEWFKIRCGKPTSSNFDKIVTSSGSPSKQAEKYMYKLAGEFITGQQEETYQNAAMIRGCELENEAISFYEMITGSKVNKTGICFDDEQKFGCSPDGLVGKNGLIEIKCPLMATHVSYLISNSLPVEYFQQVQGQLFITEREWCDFISYYPAIKPLIVRVERDEVFIKKLENEILSFCEKLNDIINKIK